MDYGQVEDGTPATTPILTTTASATRATEQNPSVRLPQNVYDFITRDREGGTLASNQSVVTTRNITARTGVRYVTRFIGFISNYLKGNASSIMTVREP
jgi:hypothetical protein